MCEAYLVQAVKSLPVMQETWVRSLGGEDLLEKEVATHSSILAWKIPWTEEPGGLHSVGSQSIRHDLAASSGSPSEVGACFVIFLYIYMYMESRKMVLMNLFSGQQRRHRHREQTCESSRERRGWDDLRE